MVNRIQSRNVNSSVEPTTCALCPARSRSSKLVFFHERMGERRSLAITFCETCGNRVEKHLSRIIPKRLTESSPLEEEPPQATLFLLADALGLGWE